MKKRPGKPRPVRIVETGQEFETLTDCAKAIGGFSTNICSCLNGRIPTYKGYTFVDLVPNRY